MLILPNSFLTSTPPRRICVQNENKNTIKADHLILNWYKSTGTLQVQGPEATNCKAFSNQLLDTESKNENETSRHSDINNSGVRESDTEVSHDPRCDQDSGSDGFITSSNFAKEIDKIWSEIKSLGDKFVKSDESDEGVVNIFSSWINNLQQKNHDLSEEICILKARLKEESDKVKKITDERDSLKTALQIVTKELQNVPNQNQGGTMTNSTSNWAKQTKKPKAHKPPQKVSISTGNRFEPLNIEESSPDPAPTNNNE